MRFSIEIVNYIVFKSVNRSTLFVLLILFFQETHAQVNQVRIGGAKVDRNITSASFQNQSAEIQLSLDEINDRIEQINEHLSAIETKRQWINSDPTLIIEANQNTWFEQMKSTEALLIRQREELVRLLNKEKR